ncbi:uncharacterized protein LOC143214059 isoform X2 [Lasioglossum baleicum]|uniref:uncharacterized protein LOC143214059 isoform X2 n=1 Tax=Lasioglossum baleicum TaxID=434251 RepID=UPI003FCDE89C
MDRISEVKFSDLQNDERYKKLERALKLSYLKKGVRLDESWPSSMSPSMSSINVDASDVNSNVPEPRASRTGSVIVSSSNNLRNVVLKKDVKNSHQTMCTSSVKDFNSTNGLQEDYFMMPPPRSNFICSASNKANSTPLPNVPRTMPVFQSKCANKQSPSKTYSSSLQISPNNAAQHAKNRIRIFTRWKVALNEQGQLVIVGTINGRQLARSKPIVRTLTPTKIQSLCNHVYQLEGIIVDNECELPDYVRGKFYNGFPDDWKNVHQIWRMYKQQGSRPTFRWPTPLADSDDGLLTEATDFTFASIESTNTSTTNSFADLQMHRNKENLNVPSLNINKNNQQNTDKEQSKESATAVAEYSYQDNKINKLKDTFDIIVNNIADKSYPQEFVSKIVEMFDSLNYFVSYGSSKENESNIESSTLEHDKSVSQEQRKDVRNDKSTPSNNGIDFNKSKCKNTDIHPGKSTASNSLNSKNPAKTNNCTDQDSSNSESEVYIGIPKIPAERILRERETLMKTYKRKARPTKLLRRHCDVSAKKQTSSINTENINRMYHDDSSVSIIRNLTDFSEVETVTNSKVENNVNKDVNLVTKEMNPREMKELVQENPTTLYKLTENCSDISNVNKSNTREINETLENENAVSKTSLRKKTSDKQSYDVLNNNYQASSNTSKPIVLSSVPVDMKIMYKEGKQARNVDRDSKGSEKEVQHLKTNKKSPAKTPNALRNIDSDVSIYSVLEEREGSRKLIQLDHARICRDKQDNGIKAKKLSDWSPKLIREPELCLCFVGQLRNDADQVVNRRFQTDAVLRRVSLSMIETISHKFYELVGDFNNHKYVVPKQLLSQCRYGCPTRINLFCKTWKSLQSNSKTEDEPGTTDIRMSSKGRKIMRPLSYWTGERLSMKQNHSVYSPGFDQDSATESMSKKSTNSKHVKETRKQQNISDQENDYKELKSPNKNNKSIVNGMEKVEAAKLDVVRRKNKKRPEPRLSSSSDTPDGKSSPIKKKQRFMENLQKPYTSDDEEESPRKLRKNSLENEETKRKTRSNAKPVMSPVRVKKISTNRYSSSAGNRYNESYRFCRNKSGFIEDDTLSEDQESYVQ